MWTTLQQIIGCKALVQVTSTVRHTIEAASDPTVWVFNEEAIHGGLFGRSVTPARRGGERHVVQ